MHFYANCLYLQVLNTNIIMQNRTKHRLIETRKRIGYSQEYLSSVLGMDISSYSRRENGQIKISNNEWIKMSETLNVP